MAPASSVQSIEKLSKWQLEGSEEVEEQGSEGHSSQSPEEEVEVEDKTEELMWRISTEVFQADFSHVYIYIYINLYIYIYIHMHMYT